MSKSTTKKLSENERAKARVAIAKDVIKRIQSGKIRSMGNGYGYIEFDTDLKHKVCKMEDDYEKCITPQDVKKIAKNCYVCAMGALILSKVGLFNQLTWRDLFNFDTREDYENALFDYFDEDELYEIEDAFECNMSKAGKFGYLFKNDNDRLLAIMQNIVDHNGTFKPEVEYEIVLA